MVRKIGLAGKSGSGKNVIADLLCAKHQYKQIAVADAIRRECEEFLYEAFQDRLPWVTAKEKAEEFQKIVYPAMVDMIWEKPTPSGIRILLQWWGTELRRSIDPDYWTKQLTNRLSNDDLIVVSDVRLPDEMKVIREAGGEVWLIVRNGVPNVGIIGHATEHGLDNVNFDRVVHNNGTLSDLETCIDSLMQP